MTVCMYVMNDSIEQDFHFLRCYTVEVWFKTTP